MEKKVPTGKDQLRVKPDKAIAIIMIVLFMIIAGLIIGVPYYKTYIAPWNQVVLKVHDATYSMRDLVKRLRLRVMTGEKVGIEMATKVLGELQEGEIIKREAERRNVHISEQELDAEIKRRVLNTGSGEGDFESLYATMLRGLRLSEKEYRKWIRTELYRAKLYQDFSKKTVGAGEQVHVYTIITGTVQKADEIRNRLEKGEDFNQLAKDESIDLNSSRKGGDLGWFPKNVNELQATAQVHAKGVLLKTEEEAQKIRDKLLAGEDFEKIARLNSLDDASREKGGYLGWSSTDMRKGKPFAPQAYELKPGDLSEPLETYEGFWLIKLIDKSPEGKLIDDIAFHQPIGQVSRPLLTLGGFYLLKTVAKDKSRPLSMEHRNILTKKAFDEWLHEATMKGSEEGWIKWNWGSETYNWAVTHIE